MILNMKGRILVGMGVFLGIICAFYFLIYLPQIKYRRTLNHRIVQYETRVTRLREKVQELKRLREENQKIRQHLSFLEEKLKQTQISFLYELGKRGRVYGIEYIDITPLPSREEKHYFRTPVKVHLYGKYHNLGMLLSDMAKRGGLGSFTVDSVLLKTSPQEEYTIEANLTFSLYRYESTPTSGSENGRFSADKKSPKKLRRRVR